MVFALVLAGCGINKTVSTSTSSTSTTLVGQVANPFTVANYLRLTGWANYSFISTSGANTTTPNKVIGEVYDPSNFRVYISSTGVTTIAASGTAFDVVHNRVTEIKLPKYYLNQMGVGAAASLFVNGLRSVGEYLQRDGSCTVLGRVGDLYLEGNMLAKVSLTTRACIDKETGALLSLEQGLGGVSSPQSQTYRFEVTSIGETSPITPPKNL
ncbi:hypothetical protein SAMN02745225_00174 [Ferrithrix thermotolerans DSM 19514]|jgi:hypothetical protein|uniref:Uncharacterized protein n=2 Tax=Ferrithrix TaxID=643949 RepID=A0A1M4SAL4_9ACTN|nr:hypothetical protein SAMN02745225_00174 [Ferrithrix thermotolerans DSM 19514]